MPTKEQHLTKAKGNRIFSSSLSAEDSVATEWALISLFYSALHLVEAFNAHHNHHCRSHQEIQEEVERNPQLEDIYADYHDLKNFGWNARYRPVRYGPKELSEAQGSFAAIEEHIHKLI